MKTLKYPRKLLTEKQEKCNEQDRIMTQSKFFFYTFQAFDDGPFIEDVTKISSSGMILLYVISFKNI